MTTEHTKTMKLKNSKELKLEIRNPVGGRMTVKALKPIRTAKEIKTQYYSYVASVNINRNNNSEEFLHKIIDAIDAELSGNEKDFDYLLSDIIKDCDKEFGDKFRRFDFKGKQFSIALLNYENIYSIYVFHNNTTFKIPLSFVSIHDVKEDWRRFLDNILENIISDLKNTDVQIEDVDSMGLFITNIINNSYKDNTL